MSKVLEITKLAMEINELGKHQVFVRISPHVQDVDISVIEGKWEKGKENIFRGYFYYDGFNYRNSDYEHIKSKLLEIKEKDLSGMAVPSRSNENHNQVDYNTNEDENK